MITENDSEIHLPPRKNERARFQPLLHHFVVRTGTLSVRHHEKRLRNHILWLVQLMPPMKDK